MKVLLKTMRTVKTLIYIIYMTVTQQLIAQDVKTFVLNNGFTVILVEDHSDPTIHGAIVTKAGSKNDPEGTTGMAHYFEHIMFKGTDKIGTMDYEKEKPYLEQIATLYDELAAVGNDESKRNTLLKKINELSIAANEYSIPGEVDRLLKKYGGTKINAYTSYDHTVYHNTFSPNHIDKWLTIYAERFHNPVFRMFQAELETIYEERNMYADRMGAKAIEDVSKNVFKRHPYRNPIIGTVKDLKTPSINKMMEFYKQYYVAGNMGLVLIGDFVPNEVLPMIRTKFASLPSGKAPVFPTEKYKEDPFRGREFYSGRYIPIKAGIACFRGVPVGHDDEIALDYCLNILSNESQTGLLDRLRIDNRLMFATAQSLSLNDMGVIVVAFVPRLLHSLKKAEVETMNVVEKLKTGDFSDELIEALRLSFAKENAQIIEDKEMFGRLLISLFSCGKSWKNYLDDSKRYQSLTKREIVEVANKYFIDNRLVFYNKTGFASKAEKIKKPPYQALPSKNTDKQSAFADQLERTESKTYVPSFIEFGKDFHYEDLQDNVHLVVGNNPINDIFTLKIQFDYGKNCDKLVELIPEHFNELGVETKTVDKLRMEMQKLCASYYFSASRTTLTLHVDGLDRYFDETMELINDYIVNIKPDESQMSKIVNSIKDRNRIGRKDHLALADAHVNYVTFGEHSHWINRVSIKEAKKTKSEDIVNAFRRARNHETTITCVSRLRHGKVKKIIQQHLRFPYAVQPAEKSFFDVLDYDSTFISSYNDPKANQTQITFYVPGTAGDTIDILTAAIFNQYFGEGMTSIMFHEIRELRSLSYSASAKYSFPNRKYATFKGCLVGRLSTQADKTVEAIEIIDSLLKHLPQKPKLIDELKCAFQESINNSRPVFREIPAYGYSLIRQGYNEDFRKIQYRNIDLFTMESINRFHSEFIDRRPVIYILTGNESKMGLDRLSIPTRHVTRKNILTE
jgi:predicted Zn-dependent peptidase